MHVQIHGVKKVCALHHSGISGASLNKTDTLKSCSCLAMNLKRDILAAEAPNSPPCCRFTAPGTQCGVHCRVSLLTLRLRRLFHHEISNNQLHAKLQLQVVLRVLGQQNDGESRRMFGTGSHMVSNSSQHHLTGSRRGTNAADWGPTLLRRGSRCGISH